jgi:hypothetical protein
MLARKEQDGNSSTTLPRQGKIFRELVPAHPGNLLYRRHEDARFKETEDGTSPGSAGLTGGDPGGGNTGSAADKGAAKP